MSEVRYPKVGEIWFYESDIQFQFGLVTEVIEDLVINDYYWYGKNIRHDHIITGGYACISWPNEYLAGRLTYIGML